MLKVKEPPLFSLISTSVTANKNVTVQSKDASFSMQRTTKEPPLLSLASVNTITTTTTSTTHFMKKNWLKSTNNKDSMVNLPQVDVIDLTNQMQKEGTTFWTSNVSLVATKQTNEYLVNLRWINYSYYPNGSKKQVPSQWKSINSRFLLNLSNKSVGPSVFLQEVDEPKHQKMQGVEDIRLFRHPDGRTYFNASYFDARTQYTSTIMGEYSMDDLSTYQLDRTIVKPSFTGTPLVMEKNWSFFTDVEGQLRVVHSWWPVKIGRIDWERQSLDLVETKTTPEFFQDARGSTPGVWHNNEWWFVLHKRQKETRQGVDYFTYQHFFAVFDRHMNCIRHSHLFQFEGAAVEYCLSFLIDTHVLLSYSILDQQSKIGIYTMYDICNALPWKAAPVTQERYMDHYFDNSTYRCYIGFYDPYPKQKTAEQELLQRIEMTCQKINVGFLLLHNDNIIRNKNHPLSGLHIDSIPSNHIICLISLHSESPKTSQRHLTLMTVWNPIAFHNESRWKSTFSVDGYLSAYSDNIDNYIRQHSQKPFYGHLNTSLSGPLLDFTMGHYRCFYVGINWEKKHNYITFNRVQIIRLVYAMDKLDMLSLYGPADSWTNCRNYVGEIAFDGVSVVHEIHRCGVCLVLSSESHLQDAVVSNRLFEGLAAGVPIISDRNPFVVQWFGDNVFYIDDHGDTDRSIEQIKEHLAFFQQEPEATLHRMKKCREIFTAQFLMDQQLLKIIDNVSLSLSLN